MVTSFPTVEIFNLLLMFDWMILQTDQFCFTSAVVNENVKRISTTVVKLQRVSNPFHHDEGASYFDSMSEIPWNGLLLTL